MSERFKICPRCEETYRIQRTQQMVCYCAKDRFSTRLETVTSWQLKDGSYLTLGSSGEFIKMKPTGVSDE